MTSEGTIKTKEDVKPTSLSHTNVSPDMYAFENEHLCTHGCWKSGNVLTGSMVWQLNKVSSLFLYVKNAHEGAS